MRGSENSCGGHGSKKDLDSGMPRHVSVIGVCQSRGGVGAAARALDQESQQEVPGSVTLARHQITLPSGPLPLCGALNSNIRN